MDLQKPRDNKMYYLSEANNLRKMDKALVRRVDKTGVFNHRILSRSEVSMTNKAANQFRSDQSKETTKSEIWKNFTVPIQNKIKERSTQVSTQASERREKEKEFRDNLVHGFYRKQDQARKQPKNKIDYGVPQSTVSKFRDLSKKLEKAERRLRYKQKLLEGYPLDEKALEKTLIQKQMEAL